VRAVSQEARAKAAKAAARRRMTIGEWVTNALITVANEELGVGRARAEATGSANGSAVSVGDEGLAAAVEGLSQRLDESSEQTRAVCRLAEHLDGLALAGDSLSAVAARLRALDSRDRALLALAERLVANERRTEARLAMLAGAMETLARRQQRPPEALERSLAPLKAAVDGLAARLEAAPRDGPAPLRAPAREPSGQVPELDYEVLNERAIDNTRKLGTDDEHQRRSGVIARLFRGGREPGP